MAQVMIRPAAGQQAALRLRNIVADAWTSYCLWRQQKCSTAAELWDIHTTRWAALRMLTVMPVGMMGFIGLAEEHTVLSLAFLTAAAWAVFTAKEAEDDGLSDNENSINK